MSAETAVRSILARAPESAIASGAENASATARATGPGGAPPPMVCASEATNVANTATAVRVRLVRPGRSPVQPNRPGRSGTGTAPGSRPGPSPSCASTQPTLITNELVVPTGVVMPNRVGPLVPAGTWNVTVAVPISSTVGVYARTTVPVPIVAPPNVTATVPAAVSVRLNSSDDRLTVT